MFKTITAVASVFAFAQASHLDNTNGVFDDYSFDEVRFKTRTNCSLDKYPEVSPFPSPSHIAFSTLRRL